MRRSSVEMAIGMAVVVAFASACGREPDAARIEIDDEIEHGGHASPALAADDPIPDTSLFQLDSALTDQEGRPVTLESFRGHPTVIVMFYGSCTTVCPLLIADGRRIERALSEQDRARTRFVLVTLDPENDTEERLRELARLHELDTTRWSLLRGSDSTVRELAMVLGVRYRRVPGGAIAHSALVTLLDPSGRIDARIEGITQPVAPIADRIPQL